MPDSSRTRLRSCAKCLACLPPADDEIDLTLGLSRGLPPAKIKKVSGACRSRASWFVVLSREATMSKLRVQSFAISIDGYGAGPNQDLDNPLGVGGMALHKWAHATRTFQK